MLELHGRKSASPALKFTNSVLPWATISMETLRQLLLNQGRSIPSTTRIRRDETRPLSTSLKVLYHALQLILHICKNVDCLDELHLVLASLGACEGHPPRRLVERNNPERLTGVSVEEILALPTLRGGGGELRKQRWRHGDVVYARQLHYLVDRRQAGREDLRLEPASLKVTLSLGAEGKAFIRVMIASDLDSVVSSQEISRTDLTLGRNAHVARSRTAQCMYNLHRRRGQPAPCKTWWSRASRCHASQALCKLADLPM